MKTQARRKEIKSDLGINREKEKKKEVFIIIMHVCFIKSVRERSREGYRRGRDREREKATRITIITRAQASTTTLRFYEAVFLHCWK